jgi:hypothetical protein
MAPKLAQESMHTSCTPSQKRQKILYTTELKNTRYKEQFLSVPQSYTKLHQTEQIAPKNFGVKHETGLRIINFNYKDETLSEPTYLSV